jgi:hypothetical protein
MSYGRFRRTLFRMAKQLRGPLCITAAHCRQSTNFSNGPRICSYHPYLEPVSSERTSRLSLRTVQLIEFSSYSIPFRSNLILSSYLCLDIPSGLFSPNFPIKIFYAILTFLTRATCPHLITLITLSVKRKQNLGEIHSVSKGSFITMAVNADVSKQGLY